MHGFDRLKPVGLLLGILLAVFGVIFLAVPETVAEFMAIFIGAIVTVIGGFRVASVIINWQVSANRIFLLIIGAVLFSIGVFMLFNPEITIAIVGAIIGIFAILMAFDRFITANKLKNTINVAPTVISGIIHLVFGVGMIYSAIVVFSIIIILVGIYMLIAGIMFALSTLLFRDF